MTDKTAVEAMARELSGHFGPLFEELPKDKKALRAWRREGFHVSDNTQADLIGAAQAALDAYHEWLKANGFAVVPVKDVHMCMAWIGDSPAECELHDRLEATIAPPNPHPAKP